MALRGALEHPKTLALADALGIMDCFALGILEAFWHHVGKYHEDGDVTNLKPSVMARSIRYTGDAQNLWDILKESGFLDDIDGKTIVHGWGERADDATQAKMYRAVKRFADGVKPKPRSIGRHEREGLDELWTVADNTSDSSRTSGGQLATVLPVPEPVPEPVPVPVPEPEPETKGFLTGKVENDIADSVTVLAVIDGEAREPTPYQLIESCLNRQAELLQIAPPTPEQIKRHLGEKSHMRQLLNKHGPMLAAEMFAFASKTFTGPVTWAVVWNCEADVLAKMKNPRRKGPALPKDHLDRLIHENQQHA